ncbi:Alkylated DNA repair protein alkB 8 [Perkinsus chesapeaki]|uniref:Alkylated DNA repair protein alkB 8 n=1 Tax=Perkinsus chesapeaki TaxID=330153 RepID=A0A7J6KZX9_PERCH|nr:Alkylated DNA repair protein alkB 8 [Perkinsus chesapeaki]
MSYRKVFKRSKGKSAAVEPTRHLFLANCGHSSGINDINDLQEALGHPHGLRECITENNFTFASFDSPEDAEACRRGLPDAGIRAEFVTKRGETHETSESWVSTTTDELPPGLTLIPDFITKEEEMKLMARVDEGDWNTSIRRRVQHFGHTFSYTSLRAEEADLTGDDIMPSYTRELVRRIATNSVEEAREFIPDQLTINEYMPGVGIAFHVDTHSAFEGPIVILSIGAGIVLEFRRPSDGKALPLWLPRRSLAIMGGESRFGWVHGIAGRKTDRVGKNSELVHRERRISLTFRQMKNSPCCCKWPVLCDTQNPSSLVLPSRVHSEERLV